MPKVSVIIPTHNDSRYLDDSIRSVLNQSDKDFELIVVDDGSTDETDKVIKVYLDDSRVRFLKKPQREGLPAARNAGIEIARGDLVAFLDADDVFREDKLSKQVEPFKKGTACDVSYTDEVYFKEGEDKEIASTRYRFSGDIFYYLKRSNFIHVSTVMARTEVFKKYKFDEHLKSHEDWELFLRMASGGVRFLYIKEALSRIRIRKDSMTVNTPTMDASRREVGLRARAYWKEFKKSIQPFSPKGQRAIFRYLRFKTDAFFIGFPKRECFNRPLPQELL